MYILTYWLEQQQHTQPFASIEAAMSEAQCLVNVQGAYLEHLYNDLTVIYDRVQLLDLTDRQRLSDLEEA